MRAHVLFILLLSGWDAVSQKQRIEVAVPPNELKSHLMFLASDEMRGRATGTIENDIAGRYIAEQFRSWGVQPVPAEYLQCFALTRRQYDGASFVKINSQKFVMKKDFVPRAGATATIHGRPLVLNSINDIETADVRDKVVVTPAYISPGKADIRRRITEKGGRAWIELTGSKFELPFHRLRLNFTNRIISTDGNGLPHLIFNDSTDVVLSQLKKAPDREIEVNLTVYSQKELRSCNVVGKVEGTDAKLKDEYVLLSAHFDHIGVLIKPTTADSIFNGTRDNAIGTAGLLHAAKYFSQHPPKRSVLFLAATAEEVGLLGSEYYANHPFLPLSQCIYNLNIDNAGYNDTGSITMYGSGRTNVDSLIRRSANAFGLRAGVDPAPLENFLERSDQMSFMKKGIPAMAFGMGMVAMDERINRYYHQLSDEVSSVDLEYLRKYICAYILTAENLANCKFKPYWVKGDKFGAIADKLYQLESEKGR
jgi:hypothetical protein